MCSLTVELGSLVLLLASTNIQHINFHQKQYHFLSVPWSFWRLLFPQSFFPSQCMHMCVDTNAYMYVGRHTCIYMHIWNEVQSQQFKSLFGPLLNKCPNFLTLSHLLLSPFPQPTSGQSHPETQLQTWVSSHTSTGQWCFLDRISSHRISWEEERCLTRQGGRVHTQDISPWQLMSHIFFLTKRVAGGSCGLSYFCLYHSSAWCLSPSSECQGRTPGSPEEIWTVDNWLILIAYKLHMSYEPQVIYLYIQVLIEDIWVFWVLQFVAVHLSHNISPWFLGCIYPGTEKAKPGFVCMQPCGGACVGTHQASGEISLERTASPANSPKDHKAEKPQSCLI